MIAVRRFKLFGIPKPAVYQTLHYRDVFLTRLHLSVNWLAVVYIRKTYS
jgi:hypothetical protein